MKNKWFIASILIVALIGLCATSLFATWQGLQMARSSGIRFRGIGVDTVQAKATEEKNLTVSGPASLTVENSFGNISVKDGADGQVAIKAEKSVWGSTEADAQAALKDLKVVIEQDGNDIHISVQQPTDVDVLHIGPGGGSVKFTISVPKETTATLHSANGDVSLDGTTGSADVQSNFGNVTVTNVSGDVLGKSNNGSVTARNLLEGQKLTFSSDFGSITVNGANGSDVSASSANGQISVTDVQASGLLNAESQFGDVRISNSQAGTAEIKSNNGTLKLEKLKVSGKVTVKSDFGSLTLTGVDADSYDLTTQNGQISLNGAQGAITAHSDFGTVEVLNAQNATIDLSSNNGAVTFSGSLGAGPHIIKSEFGNILVTLPARSALSAELQTDFGKITSDFSITIQGEISPKHWLGNINGGGTKLTVKTNNGNITLQSSK